MFFSSRKQIEKQLHKMLKELIIRPSHSPFSSQILLVKKKNGSLRFCIDYRGLNSLTIKNKFHITIINDLLDELQWSFRIFKTLS